MPKSSSSQNEIKLILSPEIRWARARSEPMPRIVVFRDAEEIRDLKNLLFGAFLAQKRGIAKCKAYEVRGPLPPSVHATCLLLAASHGDVPSCDLYVIRQAYSMALIRFVNEILDAAQVGRSVVPLHTLAADIRLPSAFVELRHAATHEDLPSIYVLRDLSQRALAWLYDEYWARQEAPETKAFTAASEDEVKNLLREWRRMKRSEPELAVVPPEIVSKLKLQLELAETEFYEVALCRNILIPAGSGVIKNRSAVLAMWMPVFQSLGSRFCTGLADRVVAQLSAREYPPSRTEHRKFSMLEAWAERLAGYLTLDAVLLARSAPRPWNALIIAKYAVSASRPDLFEDAAEMAAITGIKLELEYNNAEPCAAGWITVPDWIPKPLGID